MDSANVTPSPRSIDVCVDRDNGLSLRPLLFSWTSTATKVTGKWVTSPLSRKTGNRLEGHWVLPALEEYTEKGVCVCVYERERERETGEADGLPSLQL